MRREIVRTEIGLDFDDAADPLDAAGDVNQMLAEQLVRDDDGIAIVESAPAASSSRLRLDLRGGLALRAALVAHEVDAAADDHGGAEPGHRVGQHVPDPRVEVDAPRERGVLDRRDHGRLRTAERVGEGELAESADDADPRR